MERQFKIYVKIERENGAIIRKKHLIFNYSWHFNLANLIDSELT